MLIDVDYQNLLGLNICQQSLQHWPSLFTPSNWKSPKEFHADQSQLLMIVMFIFWINPTETRGPTGRAWRETAKCMGEHMVCFLLRSASDVFWRCTCNGSCLASQYSLYCGRRSRVAKPTKVSSMLILKWENTILVFPSFWSYVTLFYAKSCPQHNFPKIWATTPQPMSWDRF